MQIDTYVKQVGSERESDGFNITEWGETHSDIFHDLNQCCLICKSLLQQERPGYTCKTILQIASIEYF